jgi:hypothetical protein
MGFEDAMDCESQEWHRTVIHYYLKAVHQPRIRTQRELLEGMMPSDFQWKPQTTDRAKRRDAQPHTGFLDYNQRSQDKDLWLQTALIAFLSSLRAETEYFLERVRRDVLSELRGT